MQTLNWRHTEHEHIQSLGYIKESQYHSSFICEDKMQKTAKKELTFSLDTLERYKTTHPDELSNKQVASASTQTVPLDAMVQQEFSPKLGKIAISHGQTVQIKEVPDSEIAPKTKTASCTQTTSPANGNGGWYVNWTSIHATLASHAWCAMSDLIYFCDKYEFKPLSVYDAKSHQQIQVEVRALLAGQAPFSQRKRFPTDIRDPENLWVCIGRCAGVEYHLFRILSAFRKPLDHLSSDKQRVARQNFHLAVSELRLDISARISEVKLYDQLIFEREFRLEWQDAKSLKSVINQQKLIKN